MSAYIPVNKVMNSLFPSLSIESWTAFPWY